MGRRAVARSHIAAVGRAAPIREHRNFATLAPMPSPPAHPFTLTPHPATPSTVLRRIAGHVIGQRDGTLAVTYILEGDIERLRLPAPQPARFADELWRHTCCELFIACKNEPAYHECNFAPSNEWAAYAFARTRERAPLAPQGPGVLDLEPGGAQAGDCVLPIRCDDCRMAERRDGRLGRVDQVDLGAVALQPGDVAAELAGLAHPREPERGPELQEALHVVRGDLDRDVVKHAPEPTAIRG